MRRRLLLGATLVLTAACGSRSSPSATSEQLYDEAYQRLRRGDLLGATELANRGVERLGHDGAGPSRWAFHVLRAEILLGHRRAHEALAVLANETPATEADVTVRVRASLIEGYATCLLKEGPRTSHRARTLLDQAARQALATSSSRLVAEVALYSGLCSILEARYADGEPKLREALAISRQEDLPIIRSSALASLGWLAARRGHFDEAADRLRQSLDLARPAGSQSLVVRAGINLGWSYLELGEWQQALKLLLETAALAERLGYEGDRLICLNNVGRIFHAQGDFDQAARHFRQAGAIARDVGDRRLAAQITSNLGIVALERGLHGEAERYLLEALGVQRELSDLAGEQRSLLARARVLAAKGDELQAQRLFESVSVSPHAETEPRWMAHAGLAALYARRGARKRADAEFGKAIAIMDHMRARQRRAESRIAFFARLRGFYESYVRFLVAADLSERALLVTDRSRARTLSERLGAGEEGAPAASVSSFRRAAGQRGAVLLSYWIGADRSLVWVVTPQGVEWRELPRASEAAGLIDVYDSLIQRSRSPLDEESLAGQELYRILIEPVRSHIPAASRVIIVPDGPLHRLNFETLLVPGERPHYWIEDVTVTMAPSLGLLSAPRPRRERPARRLLLLGDPLEASDEFPVLPQAASEVGGISKQFAAEQQRVYAGAQAHPAAFQEAGPEDFALIHFATHVKTNRDSPLDSAVILSRRGESYKLYARDIMATRLRAELVTLSACRSAGARAYAGEGLLGFAWAFLLSGADNVIAGLWNVEDASTAALMVHLYEGLQAGQRPDEALRNAKLRLLRSDSAYRKPFYWAPFLIYSQRAAETS